MINMIGANKHVTKKSIIMLLLGHLKIQQESYSSHKRYAAQQGWSVFVAFSASTPFSNSVIQ